MITGRVVNGDGQTVGGAFVRLLDSSDGFTAEVVASATGDFRFFAARILDARCRRPAAATRWCSPRARASTGRRQDHLMAQEGCLNGQCGS